VLKEREEMVSERIAIAEKDPHLAEKITNFLNSTGYIVVGNASSGKKVIQLIIEDEPDLILMDYEMKSEIFTVVNAKEIFRIQDLPIVYLISDSQQNNLIRVKDIQPYGFVVKPVEGKKLFSIVKRAFIYHAWGKIFSDDVNLCYAMYMDVFCSGEEISDISWSKNRDSFSLKSALHSITY
jgi:DNA-binding NarL/FixJ family response regulator